MSNKYKPAIKELSVAIAQYQEGIKRLNVVSMSTRSHKNKIFKLTAAIAALEEHEALNAEVEGLRARVKELEERNDRLLVCRSHHDRH
jgi:predicted nuclease with TOPRIM domain